MSVDSDCGIIVGLPYDMIIDLEDLDELIDDGELEITSCYYDCDNRRSGCILLQQGFWSVPRCVRPFSLNFRYRYR